MGRIENHPILGPSPEGKMVKFYYNGTPMEGLEGEPIMAALKVTARCLLCDRKMYRLRYDRKWQAKRKDLHYPS